MVQMQFMALSLLLALFSTESSEVGASEIIIERLDDPMQWMDGALDEDSMPAPVYEPEFVDQTAD